MAKIHKDRNDYSKANNLRIKHIQSEMHLSVRQINADYDLEDADNLESEQSGPSSTTLAATKVCHQ